MKLVFWFLMTLNGYPVKIDGLASVKACQDMVAFVETIPGAEIQIPCSNQSGILPPPISLN